MTDNEAQGTATGAAIEDVLVSVIVPTRNNERTIEACLRSVRAQTHPRVELIVVDNHSSDTTMQVAEELADRVIVAGPERSAQRNTGIEAAQGEWIVWLDSDMNLPPDALAKALATAYETDAAGVALPERTIGDGFWTACRTLERECYLDAPWLHNPRLLRRDFMLDRDGFALEMSGPEDTDLRMRMHKAGEPIVLAPVIVDHDEGRLTVADVMRKRYYYGRSIPALAAKHEKALSTQGSGVLKAYAQNWRRLAADPVHAAGMVALRGMEAVAYAVGARRGARDLRASQGQRDA